MAPTVAQPPSDDTDRITALEDRLSEMQSWVEAALKGMGIIWESGREYGAASALGTQRARAGLRLVASEGERLILEAARR